MHLYSHHAHVQEASPTCTVDLHILTFVSRCKPSPAYSKRLRYSLLSFSVSLTQGLSGEGLVSILDEAACSEGYSIYAEQHVAGLDSSCKHRLASPLFELLPVRVAFLDQVTTEEWVAFQAALNAFNGSFLFCLDHHKSIAQKRLMVSTYSLNSSLLTKSSNCLT